MGGHAVAVSSEPTDRLAQDSRPSRIHRFVIGSTADTPPAGDRALLAQARSRDYPSTRFPVNGGDISEATLMPVAWARNWRPPSWSTRLDSGGSGRGGATGGSRRDRDGPAPRRHRSRGRRACSCRCPDGSRPLDSVASGTASWSGDLGPGPRSRCSPNRFCTTRSWSAGPSASFEPRVRVQ